MLRRTFSTATGVASVSSRSLFHAFRPALPLLSSPSLPLRPFSSIFGPVKKGLRPSRPSDVVDVTAASAAGAAPLAPVPQHSISVTACGPDRIGLVADLSHHLLQMGGNVEESRMAILGTDFAVVLRLTLPTATSGDDVAAKLRASFPSEYVFTVRPTQREMAPVSKPMRIKHFHLEGPDQPGIVAGLTKIVVRHGGSVRDLDTQTTHAPFAGYKIFVLKAVVALPTTVRNETLYTELHRFEEKSGVEIMVEDMRDREKEGEDEKANEEKQREEEAKKKPPKPQLTAAPPMPDLNDPRVMKQFEKIMKGMNLGNMPFTPPGVKK